MNLEIAQLIRMMAVFFIVGFLTGGMSWGAAILLIAASAVLMISHNEVEKRIYYAR